MGGGGELAGLRAQRMDTWVERDMGAERAFAEFNDPKGGFVDRDLYVFVIAPDKKIVAHGADKTLLGVDVTILKDVDGKAFGVELMNASAAGNWVDYKWAHPISKAVEPKSSFAKKMDNYVIGAGSYTP